MLNSLDWWSSLAACLPPGCTMGHHSFLVGREKRDRLPMSGREGEEKESLLPINSTCLRGRGREKGKERVSCTCRSGRERERTFCKHADLKPGIIPEGCSRGTSDRSQTCWTSRSATVRCLGASSLPYF